MGDIISDVRGMAEWFRLEALSREEWEDSTADMSRSWVCDRAVEELQRLSAEHIADQATIDRADEHTKMLMAEIERLKAESDRLVNVAGDALGTDPSLRSAGAGGVPARRIVGVGPSSHYWWGGDGAG